ncbi:hypothetical protein CANCADRAFT_75151 [Tortispora caseinolytica NRRL Y-17796]|uniref:Large ribosomal subunit protein mL43 n=1 Tax=Tortispora caseinolytica NRRL Y-17796 TaxID=767744 RepID=A0A1E4TJ24_9ASCO|nr:hypothetical protein CANCADRAFT_75151 [Tortispora caseinolytica NRRL Y-17796]
MPLKPVKVASIARNGYKKFVMPCKRLTFQYCNWGGSSAGMRDFISTHLKSFAAENPSTHFQIIRKKGHPIIKGEYINGREKVICTRNMNTREILQKANLLKASSGEKLSRSSIKRPVKSLNPSVRGIWSPLHATLQRPIYKL